MDVASQLEQILAERQAADLLESAAKEGQQAARRQLEQLQAAIRDGSATSGDRLQDYVLLKYGLIPDLVDKLHQIEIRLHRHQGIVLVDCHYKDLANCTGLGADPIWRSAERVTVGVLQGTELIVDRSHGLGLPTIRYAETTPFGCSKSDDVIWLESRLSTLLDLDRPFESESRPVSWPVYRLQVCLGPAEIDSWLEPRPASYKQHYQELLRLLDYDPARLF